MRSECDTLRACILPVIRWYVAEKRALPWREEPTPYHIWISEIMLQQTRIEAVLGYYSRFLEAFPDVRALAAADEDRLMKLWQGLGYYSRARNLKKAAAILVCDYGGELPRSVSELKKLPGIGDYTAGAIASIACGQPEPAVDGNVLRVVMRLLASDEDVSQPKTRTRVTELLRALYPSGEEAGLLTEGLMELGETICIPNGEPRCEDCPVRETCLGFVTGQAHLLPVKSPKKPRRTERRTVLLLKSCDRYAIRRREERGLLAGLWEFPNIEGTPEPEQVQALLEDWGLEPLEIEPCEGGVHIFTHVEWHMQGLRVRCAEEGGPFLWRTKEEILARYSIPTAFRIFENQL